MSSEQNTVLEPRETFVYNGILCHRQFYHDGSLTGERKTWYDGGRLFMYEYFRKGVLEGKSKTWHPNGVPRDCEFYRNGFTEGQRKEWYDNGQLRMRQLYCYTTSIRSVIHQEFDRNGARIELGFWKPRNTIPELTIGISKLKALNRTYRICLLDTFLISDLVKIIINRI
jgi:antitoxin component YwqK of YwqJK toxin-antitoxin module